MRLPILSSIFDNSDKLKGTLTELQSEITQLKSTLEKTKTDQALILVERNRLFLALSGINQGIVGTSIDRKVTIFNKTAEILTGLTASEALGKVVDQIIKIYDGDNALTFQNYCPIRVNDFEGVIFQKSDLRIMGKKESRIHLTTTQVIDTANLDLNCILILSDTTKEAALETMKTDFVSMAAHELRTPLTSIKGYLQVFMSENRDKLTDDQRQLLDSVSTATQQLNALIENLLNVSRIERGGVKC